MAAIGWGIGLGGSCVRVRLHNNGMACFSLFEVTTVTVELPTLDRTDGGYRYRGGLARLRSPPPERFLIRYASLAHARQAEAGESNSLAQRPESSLRTQGVGGKT